jgi:hypothetical protein
MVLGRIKTEETTEENKRSRRHSSSVFLLIQSQPIETGAFILLDFLLMKLVFSFIVCANAIMV